MVPLYGLPLEQEGDDDGKNGQGNHFLDHLELHQVEGAAVSVETDPVRRDGQAVLEEGDAPREKDDQDEGPASGDLHLLEFEMTVPGECHEDVRKNEHDDGPDALLHNHFWIWGANIVNLYDK